MRIHRTTIISLMLGIRRHTCFPPSRVREDLCTTVFRVFRRKECHLEMSWNRFRISLDRSMKKSSEATCISKKPWFSAL